MRNELEQYYRALLKHFGPQGWWPAQTPFEVMVGAILTQNTAWANVERAIGTLKSHDLLDPRRMDALDIETLALAIKPAGYFNVKARRLKSYVRWYLERYDADVDRMRQARPDRLREELLEVHGIGPETADSILLYAVRIPMFVVDQYTYRLATRHALIHEEATYEELQERFESGLVRDEKLFNEFHALIVAVGKEYCRATPRCEACPLRRFLPDEVLRVGRK